MDMKCIWDCEGSKQGGLGDVQKAVDDLLDRVTAAIAGITEACRRGAKIYPSTPEVNSDSRLVPPTRLRRERKRGFVTD